MSKPPLAKLGLMLEALEEVALLSAAGDEKYSPDSWMYPEGDVEDFCKERLNSLMRHAMLAVQNMYSRDEETQQSHLAATAWNALAILTLIRKHLVGPRTNAWHVYTKENPDWENQTTLSHIELAGWECANEILEEDENV